MTTLRELVMVTPAKVNLGLEIIKKRDDGYHDIVTILQAISIYDRFIWSDSGETFHYESISGIERDSDVVHRVFTSMNKSDFLRGTINVDKRIPASAGLGGGSSDAAMALRLIDQGSNRRILEVKAATFGSDVPFFIGGGTALATGTGVDLEPLPKPELWFVIVVPYLVLQDKTVTMYRGLERHDFSSGDEVRRFAELLRKNDKITTLPPNAFSRQMLAKKKVASVFTTMERCGAENISLSGAGPSLFTVFDKRSEARAFYARLPNSIGKAFLAQSVDDHFFDSSVDAARRMMRGA